MVPYSLLQISTDRALGCSADRGQRPLSCSEISTILRVLLQSEDKSLTSHSLKTTCLSWTAKAEVPREQRRLLGRHSSTLQDSDSVYSRDLAYAPVKALQRVLIMIRDGQFRPDEGRADYFQGANPLFPGTPAPVFQPGTPAFLAREVDPPHEKVDPAPDLIAQETGSVKDEPQELSWSYVPADDVVDLVTSSSSSSSTSGCDDVDSECEQEDEVSEDDLPRSAQPDFFLDATVKNDRTGVVHAVPDIGLSHWVNLRQ